MVAITQPIYPKHLDDPGKLCSVIEKQNRKSRLEKAYDLVGM